MMRAVRAEWTKLVSLRSNGWLLAGVVASMVAVGAAVAFSLRLPECQPGGACREDTFRLALSGVRLAQVLVVVMAAAAFGAEYENGTIGLSLAAVPRRHRVLCAKALVVTVWVAIAAIAAVALSVAVGAYAFPHNGFTAAEGYPPLSFGSLTLLRAALGTILYLCLIGLLTLGTVAVFRSNAGAISAVVGLLFLFPLTAQMINDPRWQHRLAKWGPMEAGLAIQNTVQPGSAVVAPWRGLGILGLWALAALVMGAVSLRARDA